MKLLAILPIVDEDPIFPSKVLDHQWLADFPDNLSGKILINGAPEWNEMLLTNDDIEKLFDYCVSIRFNQVVSQFHLKIRDYCCDVIVGG